ncbi:MAG: cyclic nucleotide-binding domain-containing protein [Gammaproteobacteria bacterium]|nr:cyclic nucleotide-binding domain-containing protein [Gammaproteobacteria bacterium]
MHIDEFLEISPTFSDFTPAEIEVLGKALTVKTYPQGHLFYEEGTRGSTMYIVMEGDVRVSRKRPQGRGYRYRDTLHAGDIFGLQSLIDNRVRYTTCEADTRVTVASLPKTAFNLLYHSHIAIAEHFQYAVARQLTRELRALDRQLINALSSGDVDDLLGNPA